MHVHLKLVVLAAIGGVLLFPVGLSAQSAPRPTTQELAQTKSGANDWITYGGAMNNQRYSTLDQINTTNVSGLRGAWLTRLG